MPVLRNLVSTGRVRFEAINVELELINHLNVGFQDLYYDRIVNGIGSPNQWDKYISYLDNRATPTDRGLNEYTASLNFVNNIHVNNVAPQQNPRAISFRNVLPGNQNIAINPDHDNFLNDFLARP